MTGSARAGTHTPRLVRDALGLVAFVTTEIGGYGSRFRGDDNNYFTGSSNET
jgi:hypothetical protein